MASVDAPDVNRRFAESLGLTYPILSDGSTIMFAGHAMSCFMLRQMEYDADRCETRLAGTRARVA